MGFYKLLGVGRNASKDQIKKAFRRLALEFHPDKHHNKPEHLRAKAAEKFKQINNAYDTLVDDRKRADYNIRYDNFHRSRQSSSQNTNKSTYGNPSTSQNSNKSNHNTSHNSNKSNHNTSQNSNKNNHSTSHNSKKSTYGNHSARQSNGDNGSDDWYYDFSVNVALFVIIVVIDVVIDIWLE